MGEEENENYVKKTEVTKLMDLKAEDQHRRKKRIGEELRQE
jgi:hypothetical protein